MTERSREGVKREEGGVKRIAHRNAARTSGQRPTNQPTNQKSFVQTRKHGAAGETKSHLRCGRSPKCIIQQVKAKMYQNVPKCVIQQVKAKMYQNVPKCIIQQVKAHQLYEIQYSFVSSRWQYNQQGLDCHCNDNIIVSVKTTPLS